MKDFQDQNTLEISGSFAKKEVKGNVRLPFSKSESNRALMIAAYGGFSPDIDKDGDIVFKVEGNIYWISVSNEDISPMYLVLATASSYPLDYAKSTVKMAAAETNLYKGVKVLCYDDSIAIQAEMYLMSSEHFKYTFYTLLSQIKSVAGAFSKECAEVLQDKRESYVSTSNNQQTSTREIAGYIKDSSGNIIIGAIISTNSNDRKAFSNTKGYYSISAKKGDKITVKCSGFSDSSKIVGDNSYINFTLYSN